MHLRQNNRLIREEGWLNLVAEVRIFLSQPKLFELGREAKR